jgi:hypothetical protein
VGPAEDEVGEGRALKAARLCSRLGRLISADLGSTIHVPSPAASGCEVSCREQCGVRVLRQITETLALFKPRCGPHIPFMPHQNQSKEREVDVRDCQEFGRRRLGHWVWGEPLTRPGRVMTIS